MSETKHTPTPGPWRRNPNRDSLGRYGVYGPPHPVDGGDYAPICETSRGTDANLIAAAPDLLEACENSLLVWESNSASVDPDEVCAMLRAAIAKAKGVIQ